jgi:GNAT superfamily N-acetyltransferase
MAVSELAFRDGRAADLHETFELREAAWEASRKERGLLPPDHRRDADDLGRQWVVERPLLEFIVAQPDGSFVICEDGEKIVGYARVARFGVMDELTDLWVAPSHVGRDVGRALLERCWPDSPTPELGRVVLGLGMPADLSLYTEFGVMPVTGHWHLRHRTEEYVERRSLELDSTEPDVHALTPERAVAEWKRLEPPAIGHERPRLHEFFARTRTCLATVDGSRGQAVALCWVSSDGDIGPAVGEEAEHLVPVVLAALDRVAKQQEPETFGVFCTTDSWWLLDRLRRLGFRIHWPSWVMCSVPLPGLDRYLPTRPARLL